MIGILNGEYGKILKKPLEILGLNVILTPAIKELSSPVASHPDMICTPLPNGKIVVAKEAGSEFALDIQKTGVEVIVGESKLSNAYPENIYYNCFFVGDKVFHKKGYIDKNITLCYNSVFVSQGYAKCSTVILPNNMAITSDKGIFSVLSNEGADVFYLPTDGIELKGYSCGFIGGCCGVMGDKLLFSGTLEKIGTKKELLSFLEKGGIKPIFLTDLPLFDVGTIFIF